MGATCAGHVTEKALTASCKNWSSARRRAKASTTVLAQEDGREQLGAAAAWRTSLHRHPPDDLSCCVGIAAFDGFWQCQVRYRASILRWFALHRSYCVSHVMLLYVVTDEAHDRHQLFLALAQA